MSEKKLTKEEIALRDKYSGWPPPASAREAEPRPAKKGRKQEAEAEPEASE